MTYAEFCSNHLSNCRMGRLLCQIGEAELGCVHNLNLWDVNGDDDVSAAYGWRVWKADDRVILVGSD